MQSVQEKSCLGTVDSVVVMKGEFDEARSITYASLQVLYVVLLSAALLVVVTLVLMGSIASQGKYDMAGPLYLRSVEILEKTLGPHHRNVAESLYSSASLRMKQVRAASRPQGWFVVACRDCSLASGLQRIVDKTRSHCQERFRCTGGYCSFQ